jgi:hypothetical protein
MWVYCHRISGGTFSVSQADLPAISIEDEYSNLKKVITGLASPYQRDKDQVATEMWEFPFVPNTDRKAEVLALTYPTEAQLRLEYANYVATLEKYGVDVLLADPQAAYSFDYTCPRDIGFVIGDSFFIANMGVANRASEIDTIRRHLDGIDRKISCARRATRCSRAVTSSSSTGERFLPASTSARIESAVNSCRTISRRSALKSFPFDTASCTWTAASTR